MGYSKYRNQKTVIDGIVFDSIREANRYHELKILMRARVIKDLQLQVTFILQDEYVFQGRKVRPITYVADFVYYDNEKKCTVVEDAKGMHTDVYKLKKKMFEKRYNMPITEV